MRTRALVATGTAVVLASTGAGAAASGGAPGHPPGHVLAHRYVLQPSSHGNPEGIAWHSRSRSFFVGATGDGTIYRSWPGKRIVRPFITVDPAAGRSAVGMAAARGKLYVAGGSTGKVFVYRIRTKRLVGTFDTGAGGFLKDLAVTPRGHVYVTDSFRPVVWRVTRKQVRAGTGAPQPIAVNPEISYIAGQFNLNGIVWLGRREFLTVQSATGLLYLVKIDKAAPGGRSIRQLAAPPIIGADGMIWDETVGHLVVVDGDPASLNLVKLKSDLTDGVISKVITDATLRGPSTVTRVRNRYLVVNADFANSATPFTVSRVKPPPPGWDPGFPDPDDEWLDDLKTRH